MKALTYGQQPTVIQKAILLDISEIAWAIEEEFGDVFKPYTAGWYYQIDEVEPSMPDMAGMKQQIYHCKGGMTERLVGEVEMVTVITDPNTALGSIYNDDGDLVVPLRTLEVSKKHPYAARNVFSRRPKSPVRGAEVVREYVSWIIDHSCEWQPMDPPFEQYAKHLIDDIQIEAANVIEINSELADPNFKKVRPGLINDTHLPNVLHRNILFEQLKDRLQFYSISLRQTLDAFIGRSTWETYSVKFRGHHSLHIEKLGDYRILEWERLKREKLI
jgi:hypothetical protein